MTRKRRHVVVLGAGFGGLTFCKRFDCPEADITLVDQQNHHLFQPLLYQVATAGLAAPDIAEPIRSILSRRSNIRVVLNTVRMIRLDERQVILDQGVLSYDHLVFALGGVTSYFGHPEWERFAPGLKSLDDALRMRREVLLAFERAENESDEGVQRKLMSVVVVGGGPTGVELAGAFAELTRCVLRKDFRRINPGQAMVILIEAGSRILSHLPEHLSVSAQRQLEQLGVEVRTGSKVRNLTQGRIELDTGEVLEAANIIWAAGVAAHPLTKTLGVEVDGAGRLRVLPDLSVPGHPEAFAIGDAALVLDDRRRPVPGTSPAAMQMARHVAIILRDEITSCPSGSVERPPFRYRDKGTMATIGRSAAVVKIGQLELSGFPAWVTWLLVHLIFLVGFDNKAGVLLQWAYAYITYRRGARIITGLTEQGK